MQFLFRPQNSLYIWAQGISVAINSTCWGSGCCDDTWNNRECHGIYAFARLDCHAIFRGEWLETLNDSIRKTGWHFLPWFCFFFGSFQHLFCFLIFHCCSIIPSTKGKDGQHPQRSVSLLQSARCCATSNMLAAQVGSLGQRELQHRHRWIRWDILAGPFPLTPKVCNSCFNTSVETPLIWPTSTRPWIMLMNVYLRGSWVAASCLFMVCSSVLARSWFRLRILWDMHDKWAMLPISYSI